MPPTLRYSSLQRFPRQPESVDAWLDAISLGHLKPAFTGLTLQDVLSLSNADLDCKVPSVGQRRRLVLAASSLQLPGVELASSSSPERAWTSEYRVPQARGSLEEARPWRSLQYPPSLELPGVAPAASSSPERAWTSEDRPPQARGSLEEVSPWRSLPPAQPNSTLPEPSIISIESKPETWETGTATYTSGSTFDSAPSTGFSSNGDSFVSRRHADDRTANSTLDVASSIVGLAIHDSDEMHSGNGSPTRALVSLALDDDGSPTSAAFLPAMLPLLSPLIRPGTPP